MTNQPVLREIELINQQKIINMENIDTLLKKNTIDYTEVWNYPNPTGQENFSSPCIATFSNGRQYVITVQMDWYVYVNDLLDGTLLWRKALNGSNYGRPVAEKVMGDNTITIFVASHDGTINAIDESGDIIWTQYNLYDREGSGTSSIENPSYCLVDNTKNWAIDSFLSGNKSQGNNASISIISGTGAGQPSLEISGVEPTDHTKLWTFETWSIPLSTDSVYKIIPRFESQKYFQHAGTLNLENGIWYLYVCGFDNMIIKLNTQTGVLIAKFASLQNIEAYPLVVLVDNVPRVFFSSVDNYVYCLDLSLNLIWKTSLGDGNDAFLSYNQPTQELVVSSRANRVFVINAVNGNIKCKSIDVGGDIDTKPCLYDFGHGDGVSITFSCDSGFVYNISLATGKTNWRFNQGFGCNSSINIAKINNQILIFSWDMLGTCMILNEWGQSVGQIQATGGVEGTALLGNLVTGDDRYYMAYCSIDGAVRLVRFN